MRACAAAAEVAVTAANDRAAGGNEVDPQAAVTSNKMKVGNTYTGGLGGREVVPGMPYESSPYVHT